MHLCGSLGNIDAFRTLSNPKAEENNVSYMLKTCNNVTLLTKIQEHDSVEADASPGVRADSMLEGVDVALQRLQGKALLEYALLQHHLHNR